VHNFPPCCALYRVDFGKILNRLSLYADDESMFPVIAAKEVEKLDKAKLSLPPRTDVNPDKYTPCNTSQALLAKYHPLILNDYVPISVAGDGNCLFRSVSLGLYGSEKHHKELRARAALEIATHRSWYDPDHPDYCAPFKDEPFIVCPRYADLCSSVSVSGQYADVMSVLALSCITGLRIQMFFPQLTGAFDAHPLTRCIVGRDVDETARSLTVMWTSLSNPETLPIAINHFVPLCKISANVVAVQNVVHGDESDDGDAAECDDDDDDATDNDEPQGDAELSHDDVLPQHAEAAAEPAEEPAAKRSRVEPAIGNGSCIASDDEVSNSSGTNVKLNCNEALDRFHSSQEAYQLLVNASPDVILPDVPRGRKQNCFYLVDNTVNAQRKQGNQKNRFWDDCGVWDSKKSRTVSTTFLRSATGNAGYSLKFVEERDGKYCVKRRSNRK